MTARVLHVGEDYWHRLQVLRGAGLSVDECKGVQELAERLRTGTDHHAVLLAASPMFNPAPATEIVRATVKCPVVLFSTGAIEPEPHRYDLVIHPLTDPMVWLEDVWTLIRRTQETCADSREIREVSQQLRDESAEARRWSREQRERARRLIRGTGNGPRKMDGE